MKPMLFSENLSSTIDQPTLAPLPALARITPVESDSRKPLRHILLGSPAAVRQAIHLLHILHYAETVLWSPIMTTEEPLIITPAQGEAVSLLRRYL